MCLTKYSPQRHYKEINPTTVIMIKNQPKIYICLTKYSPPCHYKKINPIFNIVMRPKQLALGKLEDS